MESFSSSAARDESSFHDSGLSSMDESGSSSAANNLNTVELLIRFGSTTTVMLIKKKYNLDRVKQKMEGKNFGLKRYTYRPTNQICKLADQFSFPVEIKIGGETIDDPGVWSQKLAEHAIGTGLALGFLVVRSWTLFLIFGLQPTLWRWRWCARTQIRCKSRKGQCCRV